MDHSKTQVFKITNEKIEEKATQREFVEKDVQKFYEDNLKELLGAEKIKTEYAIEGGRLDTFAIDQDNRPVIIEYKRDTSDSVLLQALFYKNYIKNNWQKAYMTIMEEKGKEVADAIEFNNIRVILVAQKYDKWTIASTSFLEGVELYSFAFYENTFIQEYLNEPKLARRKRISTAVTSEDTKNYVNASEANYEIDEYVITKSGNKDKTNAYRLNSSNDIVKKMYDAISNYVWENIPQTELIFNKEYWFYKFEKKYMELIFHKSEVLVQLRLPKGIQTELNVENLSKGHWGTLNQLVRISKEEDLESIFKLIDVSFETTSEIN